MDMSKWFGKMAEKALVALASGAAASAVGAGVKWLLHKGDAADVDVNDVTEDFKAAETPAMDVTDDVAVEKVVES